MSADSPASVVSMDGKDDAGLVDSGDETGGPTLGRKSLLIRSYGRFEG
jgi:hypothetical protein